MIGEGGIHSEISSCQFVQLAEAEAEAVAEALRVAVTEMTVLVLHEWPKVPRVRVRQC